MTNDITRKDKEFRKLHLKFAKMVDELYEHGLKSDPELVDGLRWIKAESLKRGISHYQLTYEVLAKYDAEQKAKDFVVNQITTIKENRKKTHCINCSTEKIKGSNFCHKCGVTLP